MVSDLIFSFLTYKIKLKVSIMHIIKVTLEFTKKCGLQNYAIYALARPSYTLVNASLCIYKCELMYFKGSYLLKL